MANLSKIVYLSEAQCQELFANGSVTSGGVTVEYSANDLYVTPASPDPENAEKPCLPPAIAAVPGSRSAACMRLRHPVCR